MLNAATRSATPANTRSTVWKKPTNALSTSSRCSAVSWCPVIAVTSGGSDARRRATRADWSTPSAPCTSTPVSAPGRPRSRCCASAVVNAVNVVPAMLSAVPKVAMPTTVTGTRCGRSTLVRLPTCSPPSSAAARSMTTSPAPAGARPATIRHGLRPAGVTQLDPVVGGPLPPMRSPSAPRSCAWPSTRGAVARTPSTRATAPTSDSGMLPWAVTPSAVMRWLLRTTASVSRLASVKSVPKLLRTESPSTSVPARNATPTSTAVNIPARRRLRLHRSLRITWLMSVSEGLHALEHARWSGWASGRRRGRRRGTRPRRRSSPRSGRG